jgi:hypothetical protein
MKLTLTFFGLLWLAESLICEVTQAAIVCPSMPDVSQINRDVRSDIQGSVGSLGKLRAGDVGVKTEVVAKNLFEKYPNIDRLVTVQMMSATYCSILRDSTGLSETDRQERWEKFQERVFSFVSPDSPRSATSKSPSSKQAVKKPDKMSDKNPARSPKAVTQGESKTDAKANGKSLPQSERAPPVPEQQASSPAATPPKPVTPPKAKSPDPTLIPQDR